MSLLYVPVGLAGHLFLMEPGGVADPGGGVEPESNLVRLGPVLVRNLLAGPATSSSRTTKGIFFLIRLLVLVLLGYFLFLCCGGGVCGL